MTGLFKGIAAGFSDFMQGTLTLELETDGPTDPLTDAPTGTATVTLLISQDCMDMDLTANQRAQLINSGVQGAANVSRCMTAWFPWPDVPDGSRLVIRVNGKFRPLLKAGPPVDQGGQKATRLLELGPPEFGR